MYKPRILTAPLALAGALILLLAAPLAAAPACTGAKIATRAVSAEKGRSIRTAQELSAALKNAKGGEVFVLDHGNYGALNIKTAFRKPVTLRSASAKTPACFTKLQLNGAENLTLDGLVFDYAYSPGERIHANKFRVANSSNIIFTGSVFDGDLAKGTGTAANGLGTGRGLIVKGSTNIDVLNSEFYNWWTGLTINTSTDIRVAGNNIHSIRSDGMKLGQLQTVLVENNYIHDFHGDASLRDHRDMIQIQRSSGIGVQDLTIQNNVFDMGAGDWTQTIWAGHDKADFNDPTNWHRNVLIENNVIYNAHTHGISINLTDGLSIRRNSVIRVRRSNKENISIPKILISKGSKNVVVEQNVVSVIGGYKGQPDWVVLNNALIQDTSPGGPGFYDRQFIYYTTGASHGHHEYGVRPGSMVDRLKAGSTLVQKYPTRK